MSDTVVVTGIGVASPIGLGREAYWQALLQGRSAIGPVTRFDVSAYNASLGAEIQDFDPLEHLPNKLMPQTDPSTRLALVAAEWAMKEAGVDTDVIASEDFGIVTAAAGGGYEFGQKELAKLHSQGPSFVSAYQSFAWFYAVNTGQVSIRNGLRGAGSVVISDQAGGLDAIGQARRQVRGSTRVSLAGGLDSPLCPWAWVSHQASRLMSTSTDPATAYLPFDRRADGYVPGEGGAMLVLETPESAAERGITKPYGEVAGYASTFDSQRPGSLPGLQRAIGLALADAGLQPGDIDVVFADAAGDLRQDAAEAQAIGAVFGPRGVPVTAPKTMTGRLFAGGAALDVATALLALAAGVIPATTNVDVADEYELDLVVGQPRQHDLRTALVLARGRGGFNSAVIVRRAH